MKNYEKNSPEAVSRMLAMMMISDAMLDDREVEVLDRLRAFDIVGISRAGFSQVVQDYCAELLDTGGASGRINLMDKQRMDRMIDSVDDPRTRVNACGIILNIANADGRLHESELAVLGYILERWGMTLDTLERELARH